MSPRSLVEDLGEHGRITGSTATFGAPFFGDRVLGMLSYAEPSSSGAPHCAEADYGLNFCDKTSERAEGETKLIDIMVVRRGGCSFVTKVKVAAKKCAHAVIIVDKVDSNLTSKEMKNIIVADDGYGSAISIPSVLIAKDKGLKLIDKVKSKTTTVVAELNWEIPADHTVNVDMWISSASRECLRFLREFAGNRRTLNSVMKFTPHYAVFGMDGDNPGKFNDLCWTTDGRYCAEDPDGSGPITGQDVLREDVRQLCIHEKYKTEANGQWFYSDKFWSYIEKLGERCPLDGTEESSTFGTTCSKKLMQEVGIDPHLIEKCSDETWEEKLKDQREHPAWSPRAVRINGWRYTGMLEPDLVTRAICAGFTAEPEGCKKLKAPRDPTQEYQAALAAAGKPGVSFGELIGWLFLTLVLAFGALLLYKRYLKKEMRISVREEVMLEVRNAMSEYRQMQG